MEMNVIIMLNTIIYDIFIPSELLPTAFLNWPLTRENSTGN